MPVACAKEKTSRPFKSFRSHPLVNAVLGPPLHAVALDHVRRRLGNPDWVQEVDAPQDVRPGWLDGGGIVVNTGRPVQADTPLHELTHLMALVLRGAQGPEANRFRQLQGQLANTPEFLDLAREYPLSATYSFQDQAEEVGALLIGQAAARRLALGRVPVVGRALVAAERALGRFFGYNGRVLNAPLHALVSALADDVLSDVPLNVDPDWIRQTVNFARNQGGTVASTARDFLNTVSGTSNGVTNSQLIRKAHDGLEQVKQGKTTITLPSLTGGLAVPFLANLAHLSEEGRRDYVIEHQRRIEASKDAVVADAAEVLLNLEPATLATVLAGDTAALNEAAAASDYSYDQLKALADQLGNAFFDVQKGDIITRYQSENALLADGHYDPAFDDGMTYVHLKPRTGLDGQPVTEAVVVKLMSQPPGAREAGMRDETDLSNNRDDKPLLSGLYSGSWGKVAKGWAVRKLRGLKLTNSSLNRSMLSGTALAMHLSGRGLHVTGVAVGKIDMGSTPEVQCSDVRLVPVTDYVQAWEAMAKQPELKELMPAALVNVLSKPELFDLTRYSKEYVRTLYAYAEGKKHLKEVYEALGEWEAEGRANSAMGILRAIENRLQELAKENADNPKRFYKNKEVIVLGEAHRQLMGITPVLNKFKDIGGFEQYWRGFNAGDNADLQWFYEQWRASREMVTDAFLHYQKERIDRTNALMDDFHQHEGMQNYARHDEGKYYDALFHKMQQEYTDAKGDTRTMEINEYRFKMPGTPEFVALREPQQEYITWALGAMKQVAVARYSQDNPHLKPAAVEKWYQKNWGKGYVPLITGDVSRAAYAGIASGEVNSQLLNVFQNQLEENYTYDQQANQNKQTLSDRFAMQVGPTDYGSNTRLTMLGLMATNGRDRVTGQPKTVYVLDPEGGRVRQLALEPDFRKTIDQYTMSTLKHMQATHLQTQKMTAVAMLRSGIRESGLLRGTKGDSENSTPAEELSTAEQNLNRFYQFLVLGHRNQDDAGEGARVFAMALGAAGKVASLGALGFSITTAAGSQASNVANAVGVGISNWGQKQGLSFPTMGRAIKEFAQPGKLWAICRLLRTLDMDEYSLMEDRLHNGVAGGGIGKVVGGIRATDLASGKESFILDRMGDIACRMWLTAAQMMQDGSWDAYTFNEQTGELTFSEAKMRELKGNATVDAVRNRMLETGELQPGQEMKRGHDDRMRGSIESWNAEVLGGYKEEVETIMGSNIFLRSIRKFRTYALKVVDNWTKDERVNVNAGYYDNGQWVSREEVGLFKSFAKLLGGFGVNQLNVMKTWGELTEADRYNLKRAGYGSLFTGAALLLATFVFGDDEEDIADATGHKKAAQQRTLTQHIMNSLIQDQFILYQMSNVGKMVQSPFVALSFLDRMKAAAGNYLVGDFEAGNRIVGRNIGIFKTGAWVQAMIDTD